MTRKLAPLILVIAVGFTLGVPVTAASQPQGATAKKCKKKHHRHKCKKKAQPVGTPAPHERKPGPLVPPQLMEFEVQTLISNEASEDCSSLESPTSACDAYGPQLDEPLVCETKSTYSWSCYGWIHFGFAGCSQGFCIGGHARCDFRDVVERVVPVGVTSHRDLSYGSTTLASSPGWNCVFSA